MRTDPRSLKLYSANGEFLYPITYLEAQRLVDNEQAIPLTKGDWRDRRDVEWLGAKLVLPKDQRQSPASISASEMRVNAGAYSDRHSPSYVEMVRAKVEVWPFVGDTRAVSVRPRV